MHPLFRVTPFDPHLLNMNCKRLEVGLLQSQDIFKVTVILNPLRFLKNVNGNLKVTSESIKRIGVGAKHPRSTNQKYSPAYCQSEVQRVGAQKLLLIWKREPLQDRYWLEAPDQGYCKN